MGQKDAVAVLSRYLGCGALIAMALSQRIATRWPGLPAEPHRFTLSTDPTPQGALRLSIRALGD